MKRFLIALLALTGLAALSSPAEAGQFARVYTNGGVTYVPKAVLLGDSYYDQVARNNARERYLRSLACRRSERPYYSEVRSVAPCDSRPVYYRPVHRVPRLSFSFGF